jgi:hypothetical protein
MAPENSPADDAENGDAKNDADLDSGKGAENGDEVLGDAGKRALEAERKARRAAEKALGERDKRLKEIEDADKTASQVAQEAAMAAEKRAETAEAKALRLEVGGAKGLTPSQAARLVGGTREELEVDADELLASFAPAKGDLSSKPKERLRPGATSDDSDKEIDIAKVAAGIPR